MCVLGPRLISEPTDFNCTKGYGNALWDMYCTLDNGNVTENLEECDPYFAQHNLTLKKSILGLASGVFMSEWGGGGPLGGGGGGGVPLSDFMSCVEMEGRGGEDPYHLMEFC